MSISQTLSNSSTCFAAFEPRHMAQALTEDLMPSSRKVYLFLHTIAPFGRFYCWNEEVSLRSVRIALGMIPRTFQRARRELKEKKLLAETSRGFKLLKRANRGNPQKQAARQSNLFLWSDERSLDRMRSPEAFHSKDSDGGKDQTLSTNHKYLKETKTQSVCQNVNVQESRGEEQGKSLIVKCNAEEQLSQKRKNRKTPKPTKRKGQYSAAAFTKLNEKYLAELQSIGIQPEQVNNNMVRQILAHSWQAFTTAVAYTRMRLPKQPIKNPIGYMLQALRDRYPLPQREVGSERATPEATQWLDVAIAKQLVVYSVSKRDGKGGVNVCLGDREVDLALAMKWFPLAQLQRSDWRMDEQVAQQLRHHFSRLDAAKSQDAVFVPDPVIEPMEKDFEAEAEPELAIPMSPTEAQEYIELFLPQDAADPSRDFQLKLQWFNERLREFGRGSLHYILPEWDLLKRGWVELVHRQEGYWELIEVPF